MVDFFFHIACAPNRCMKSCSLWYRWATKTIQLLTQWATTLNVQCVRFFDCFPSSIVTATSSALSHQVLRLRSLIHGCDIITVPKISSPRIWQGWNTIDISSQLDCVSSRLYALQVNWSSKSPGFDIYRQLTLRSSTNDEHIPILFHVNSIRPACLPSPISHHSPLPCSFIKSPSCSPQIQSPDTIP